METIGDYQLVRLLGEGGMGKVYEAEERLSQRRVALKVLRPELGRLESARRLFKSEMAVMAKLDHPNIVRALAFLEIDDKLVMSLELLDGKTLRNHLSAQGRLPLGEAISIVEQMARALCEAHEHEPAIVHRDLKPENVMLLADGTVKVMDFGIAKVLAAAGNTTTHSVGTLAYMSPEQIDAGPIDARSDLYCLGLILYELLAGHPPFESQSPRELLNMQCTATPPALPDDVRRELPRGVERLVFELLQKSPDERPESARDVLDALESYAPADRASDKPRPRKERPRSATLGTSGLRHKREAAARAAEGAASASDTIALIEQACAPRNVPPRTALVIVLAASLFSAGVTWLVRSSIESHTAAAQGAWTER
ncbi:MAG TPA: serine/threonine-protein kinase [Polyangiaceae bacterium]|nr:serine/threonine-protein kinase [Polyangiaceae bacterium]